MPEPELYFHSKGGNPTELVPYAGRDVLVEVVGGRRKVVGFVHTQQDAHSLYFYRMPRSDEDAAPVTCFQRITDGKQRKELTDMLIGSGAQSVDF